MRHIFLFLLLISFEQSYTQISKAYEEYIGNINKAELAAIDQHYSKALNNYKDAFTYVNVFGKDYYNAAVCAIYEKKHDIAFQYIKEVIAKGYDIDSIKNDSIFGNYFVKKDFEMLSSIKIKCYDNIIKQELDSMLTADQFFRKKEPRNYMQSKYADTIMSIDSTNVIALKKIINYNGFPSEFQINLDPDYLANYHWYVLLMHQGYGSPSRFYDFSKIILNAMQKGELLPHWGTYLYTRSSGMDSLFGSGSIFKVTDGNSFKYSYINFSDKIEEKYNRNRQQYGLESLEDYRKKIVYWVTHKDLKFDFWISSLESEVIERFPDNFKDLKDLQ